MTVDILERISDFTPLGLRFWDTVQDAEVTGGLVVRGWAIEQANPRPVTAQRTLSGIYTLAGLPGLRDVETGRAPPASPPTRRFVVTVEDPEARFVAVAFTVDLPLPYRGVFLGPNSGISPPLPGFLLYPAPNRRRPTWLAAVRGELEVAATGARAGHAVVSVADADGRTWSGIADDAGRFAVFLAWPSIGLSPVTSPPSSPAGSGLPLGGQSWPLTLSVAWDPAGLTPLPGTALPDHADVLAQPATDIWPDPPATGTAAASLALTLEFGAEVSARTATLSRLLIGAAPSSP